MDATTRTTDMAANPATTTTSPREALVACLALVDETIAHVCRRYRLAAEDKDDFAGHVRLKLVDDDYAILRKFRHGCSLQGYLRVVIERLLLDFRDAQWGRWRPSAQAKRHGALAMLLDRLMTRDGLTFDEACTVLRTNHQVPASREELYDISLQLPHRPKRRLVQETPESVPATYGHPGCDLAREEASRDATRMKAALKNAVARLTAGERQLLEMRYREGRPVAHIARTLGQEPKPLYRRLERIVRKLGRPVLAAARVAQADAGAFRAGDVSISW